MKECWGCTDPLPDTSSSDYCDLCQVSLQLIRLMQEHGTQVLWTIPEMSTCHVASRQTGDYTRSS